MGGETLQVVVLTLTAVTLAVGLVGLAARFILVPWLKTTLIDPVEETRNQVTPTDATIQPPELIPTLFEKVEHIERGIQTTNERLDDHLVWSEGEVNRIWQAIRRRKPPAKPTPPPKS